MYPRPPAPTFPASNSPLRSHFPGATTAAAAGAAAGRRHQQQRQQQDGDASGGSGSDSPSADDSSSGSDGGRGFSRDSMTPPLDFGRLRRAARAAQQNNELQPLAAHGNAGKQAADRQGMPADDFIPAHRGGSAAVCRNGGGSTAAGPVTQQRRSAAGMVTRAMGRQLRGLRDAAVAAASPRVGSSAIAASDQQQQVDECHLHTFSTVPIAIALMLQVVRRVQIALPTLPRTNTRPTALCFRASE